METIKQSFLDYSGRKIFAKFVIFHNESSCPVFESKKKIMKLMNQND